ncbi:hypothetical protein NO1_0854 [Candidatus Termititenax aidoneus]|uniref:EF-hand domain-containing protein n=1 Tax=Termititenax aidoneus TaxID=2218524 RepID=A0A388TAX9_TERA1|nr:hypothetical protein NO1_0854 [Candidatus Termititenax aidoneus]
MDSLKFGLGHPLTQFRFDKNKDGKLNPEEFQAFGEDQEFWKHNKDNRQSVIQDMLMRNKPLQRANFIDACLRDPSTQDTKVIMRFVLLEILKNAESSKDKKLQELATEIKNNPEWMTEVERYRTAVANLSGKDSSPENTAQKVSEPHDGGIGENENWANLHIGTSDSSEQAKVNYSLLEAAKTNADRCSAELANGAGIAKAVETNEHFLEVLETYQPDLANGANAVEIHDYIAKLDQLKDVLTARENLLKALGKSDPDLNEVKESYDSYITAMQAYDPENPEIKTLTLETLMLENTDKAAAEGELREFQTKQNSVRNAIKTFQDTPNKENYENARRIYMDFYSYFTGHDFKNKYALSLPEADTIFSVSTIPNADYENEESRRNALQTAFNQAKSDFDTEIAAFKQKFPNGASAAEIAENETQLRNLYTAYVAAAQAIDPTATANIPSLDKLFQPVANVYTLRINGIEIKNVSKPVKDAIEAQAKIISSTTIKYVGYESTFKENGDYVTEQLKRVKGAALEIQRLIRANTNQENFVMTINPVSFINVSDGKDGDISLYTEDKENAALLAYIISEGNISNPRNWDDAFNKYDFRPSKTWKEYLAAYKKENSGWEEKIKTFLNDDKVLGPILYAYQINNPEWGGKARAKVLREKMVEVFEGEPLVSQDNELLLTIFAVKGNTNNVGIITDADGNVAVYGDPKTIKQTGKDGQDNTVSLTCPSGAGGGFALPVSVGEEKRSTISSFEIRLNPPANNLPPTLTTYKCAGFEELTITPESMPPYIVHSEKVPEAPAAPPDPGRNIPPYAPALNETYTVKVGEDPKEITKKYPLDIKDSPGDTHTLTLGELPEGLTEENIRFEQDENGKWQMHVSGLPPREDTADAYRFEYTVTDQGGAAAKGTISITVRQAPVNDTRPPLVHTIDENGNESFTNNGIAAPEGKNIAQVFKTTTKDGKEITVTVRIIDIEKNLYGVSLGFSNTTTEGNTTDTISGQLTTDANFADTFQIQGTFTWDKNIDDVFISRLVAELGYQWREFNDGSRGDVTENKVNLKVDWQGSLNFKEIGARLSLGISSGVEWQRQDWTTREVVAVTKPMPTKNIEGIPVEKDFNMNEYGDPIVSLTEEAKAKFGESGELRLLAKIFYTDDAGETVLAHELELPDEGISLQDCWNKYSVPSGKMPTVKLFVKAQDIPTKDGETRKIVFSNNSSEMELATISPGEDKTFSLSKNNVILSDPADENGIRTVTIRDADLDQFNIIITSGGEEVSSKNITKNEDGSLVWTFDQNELPNGAVLAIRDRDSGEVFWTTTVTRVDTPAAASLSASAGTIGNNYLLPLTIQNRNGYPYTNITATIQGTNTEVALIKNSDTEYAIDLKNTNLNGKTILLTIDGAEEPFFSYTLGTIADERCEAAEVNLSSCSVQEGILSGQLSFSGDSERFDSFYIKIGDNSPESLIINPDNNKFSYSLPSNYNGAQIQILADNSPLTAPFTPTDSGPRAASASASSLNLVHDGDKYRLSGIITGTNLDRFVRYKAQIGNGALVDVSVNSDNTFFIEFDHGTVQTGTHIQLLAYDNDSKPGQAVLDYSLSSVTVSGERAASTKWINNPSVSGNTLSGKFELEGDIDRLSPIRYRIGTGSFRALALTDTGSFSIDLEGASKDEEVFLEFGNNQPIKIYELTSPAQQLETSTSFSANGKYFYITTGNTADFGETRFLIGGNEVTLPYDAVSGKYTVDLAQYESESPVTIEMLVGDAVVFNQTVTVSPQQASITEEDMRSLFSTMVQTLIPNNEIIENIKENFTLKLIIDGESYNYPFNNYPGLFSTIKPDSVIELEAISKKKDINSNSNNWPSETVYTATVTYSGRGGATKVYLNDIEVKALSVTTGYTSAIAEGGVPNTLTKTVAGDAYSPVLALTDDLEYEIRGSATVKTAVLQAEPDWGATGISPLSVHLAADENWDIKAGTTNTLTPATVPDNSTFTFSEPDGTGIESVRKSFAAQFSSDVSATEQRTQIVYEEVENQHVLDDVTIGNDFIASWNQFFGLENGGFYFGYDLFGGISLSNKFQQESSTLGPTTSGWEHAVSGNYGAGVTFGRQINDKIDLFFRQGVKHNPGSDYPFKLSSGGSFTYDGEWFEANVQGTLNWWPGSISGFSTQAQLTLFERFGIFGGLIGQRTGSNDMDIGWFGGAKVGLSEFVSLGLNMRDRGSNDPLEASLMVDISLK